MTTTINEQEGIISAIFSGELDTAAAITTESELKPLMESKGRDIVLDCTDLKYISSSGLRLFLTVLKKGKSAGEKVTLKGLNNEILKVFKMTGFYDLFEIE